MILSSLPGHSRLLNCLNWILKSHPMLSAMEDISSACEWDSWETVRLLHLGEVLNSKSERWGLQLKGAGKTPYSLFADGLAVLRSSIQEFLCSEAMHSLVIPTTRALCLVTTGKLVTRDMFYGGNPKEEPGAIVWRVAPSFLRLGSY